MGREARLRVRKKRRKLEQPPPRQQSARELSLAHDLPIVNSPKVARRLSDGKVAQRASEEVCHVADAQGVIGGANVGPAPSSYPRYLGIRTCSRACWGCKSYAIVAWTLAVAAVAAFAVMVTSAAMR